MKLTDHDIQLARALINERLRIIGRIRELKSSLKGLTDTAIAGKFEVTRSYLMRAIESDRGRHE